jgi:NTP pyrophosphatase (non-canonical NTP hydrolase)
MRMNLNDKGIRIDFDKYQELARSTRLESADTTYAILGLTGEVGELNSYLAKCIRDGKEYDVTTLMKEIGDILWFLSAICDDVGVSLEDVAALNLIKLLDRQKRGKIQGSGDNR